MNVLLIGKAMISQFLKETSKALMKNIAESFRETGATRLRISENPSLR